MKQNRYGTYSLLIPISLDKKKTPEADAYLKRLQIQNVVD
jgi:hypothetical protein